MNCKIRKKQGKMSNIHIQCLKVEWHLAVACKNRAPRGSPTILLESKNIFDQAFIHPPVADTFIPFTDFLLFFM
jgi:hypothetical protein